MKSQTKQVLGLSFVQIERAMTHTNVCSYIKEEYAEWLETQGLHNKTHVAMATHSGGGRRWTLESDRHLEDVPFFVEEAFDGGWYHFQETDACRLESTSGSSGSRLIATKQGPDNWALTLEVPVLDAGPYDGVYTDSFKEAIGDRVADESEGNLELTEAALNILRRRGLLSEEHPTTTTNEGEVRRRRPRRRGPANPGIIAE